MNKNNKGGKASEVKKKNAKPKAQALQIYVGEEMVSVAQTVQKQINYLAMQTPEKYIMKREGRGGLILEYVETNYVIGRLNATFFFNWDSEIVEQIIDREHNQIAMKVRLTVRFANGNEVKKDAWGGSDIKWTKGQTKKMIDFADDLKSAESDGIKKAASMLGICWDVYAGLKMNGKKKKEKEDYTDDGFTDMGGSPDVKSEFRTIPIMINKKKIMHTKYEALDRFKKAKEQLGKELYYKILGENGYEKANQITNKDIPKLYDAMVEAYKATKVPAPKKEEEEIKPAPEKKTEKETKPKVIEEPFFPDDKSDDPKDQSLGFSTDEVEKEGQAEFPSLEKKKEEKTEEEKPLQREIMSLTSLEADLVDKHGFTPDQICEKLREMFNEDEGTKLTRKQTQEGITYFKGVIEELNEAKQK